MHYELLHFSLWQLEPTNLQNDKKMKQWFHELCVCRWVRVEGKAYALAGHHPPVVLRSHLETDQTHGVEEVEVGKMSWGEWGSKDFFGEARGEWAKHRIRKRTATREDIWIFLEEFSGKHWCSSVFPFWMLSFLVILLCFRWVFQVHSVVCITSWIYLHLSSFQP